MKKAILNKLKESAFSVLPVAVLVLIISFTPLADLTWPERIIFFVSALFLIVGMGLFSLGADLSMSPMGEYVGAGLTKTRKIGLLLAVCFFMGLLITVAEPDLSVLAGQVSTVINPTVLILSIGVGVGLFLVIAIGKIFSEKSLALLLMFFYMVMFCLAALLLQQGKGALLALSFDSGGVTTGPVTVPFIMALGIGIAQTIGGKKAGESSFGTIALCSVGPIIAVLLLSLFSTGTLSYEVADYSMENFSARQVFSMLFSASGEVLKSLALIVGFFILIQIFILKLSWKALARIGIGLIYTFAGLVVFLAAVSIGFMPVGYKLGSQLAESGPVWLTVFAFVLGMLTVLAEPAVHVLNNQVENVTGGEITKRQMMIALSIGVGISIAISMLRIIFGFSILMVLIPGYLVSLGLSLAVPGIYTSIAFDSGGVASGPLTSSFILPLAIGACVALNGAESVLSSAFGVVALVAMTPLITIQILGFKSVVKNSVRRRLALKRIISSDDGQIIYF
ncbi:MAG: DUF1538 domain-containing protein [Lachnospiraceae bacterium]|nr:DUF1538 domain-containing protein [Lachnospiraceae bacterium]